MLEVVQVVLVVGEPEAGDLLSIVVVVLADCIELLADLLVVLAGEAVDAGHDLSENGGFDLYTAGAGRADSGHLDWACRACVGD